MDVESNDTYRTVVIGSEEEAKNALVQAVLPTHFNGKHVGFHVNPDSVFVSPGLKVDNKLGVIFHKFQPAGKCEGFNECGMKYTIVADAIGDYK